MKVLRLILFPAVFTFLFSFSFAETRNISGSSSASGTVQIPDGSYSYTATIKYQSYPMSKELPVKAGIFNFSITAFQYKGVNASQIEGVNLPISVSKVQMNLSADAIFYKPGTNLQVSIPIRILAVGQGALDYTMLEKADRARIKQTFNITNPSIEFYELGIRFENIVLSTSGYINDIYLLKKKVNEYLKNKGTTSQTGSSGSSANQENRSQSQTYSVDEIAQMRAEAQNKQQKPKSALERQNEIQRAHEAHVRENNQRYASQQAARQAQQPVQNNTPQTGNFSADQQRKIDEYNREQERIRLQVQRQMQENRARMQRIEFYNNRSLDILSQHIASFQPLPVNISSIQSSSSPQQVLSNLNSIERQLKSQIQQNNANLAGTLTKYSQISSGSTEEAQANLVGAAAATIGTIAANQEAKKQMQEAKERAQAQMRSFYNKQLEYYNNIKDQLLATAVHAFEAQTEEHALSSYFYYKCLEEYTANNFSYSSTRWAEADQRANCSKPYAPQVYQQQRTGASYLAVAKRKYALYKKYDYKDFLEAAKLNLNNSLRTDKNNAEAYLFSAKLSEGDVISELHNLSIAKSIQAEGFSETQWYNNCFKRFESKFYQELSSVSQSKNAFIAKSLASNFYPKSTKDGLSPILYALQKDNLPAFKQLVDYSKTESEYSKSYFIQAFAENKINIAKHYYNRSYWQKLSAREQKNSLIAAFENNSLATIMLVPDDLYDLESYVRFDDKKKEKLSKIYFKTAIETGKVDLVDQALKFYPLPDEDLANVLENISTGSDPEIVKKMVSAISDKNTRISTGESLYNLAIKKNSKQLLDFLVAENFELPTESNFSPVGYLMVYQPSNILPFLKNYPFNYNQKDVKGIPVIHKIAYKMPQHLPYYLRVSNIDLNQKGLHGWTALHYAARENNLNAVKQLLAAGADKNAKDIYGRRPFNIAKERKYKNIKKHLK